MCAGCLSASQDMDANPFGIASYGSMGDKGIAMKNDPRFDGDEGQDQKFEGTAPAKSASAKLAENTGHQ